MKITRCFLLFLAALLADISVFGQQRISPGGVKGPLVWFATDSNAVKPSFRSLIGIKDSILVMRNAAPNLSMNFHPSLSFKGTDSLSIPLGDSSLASATFFFVYRSQTPKAEGAVWYLSKHNKAGLISTTSRMADLETYQYMNFSDLYPTNAKVSTYMHQKIKDTIPSSQFLKIGRKPVSPSLPIYAFTGLIPEVIVYNRVLSSLERLKVESYLAIKYGVTLSAPSATYLNSSGKIIWEGMAYTNYYHNIAGIARDDSSGLVQPKATSTNQPGLLTVTAEKQLQNNTSLVWGDNDKSLSEGPKILGMPTLLQKKWLMVTVNNNKPLSAEIVLNTKDIDAPTPADPVYWMLIDRSGTGDFTLPATKYVKMSSLDKDGKAHFEGVSWGSNPNHLDIVAFTVGNNLLATITANSPDCGGANNGSIAVKISGGVAPFNLVVTKANGETVAAKSLSSMTTETINKLIAGKYFIKLTDAMNAKYSDSVYLNDLHGPQPIALAPAYALPANGMLFIKADSLMPPGLSYQWTGPNGFSSFNADVRLTKPGTYTLKCSNEGCSYLQDVTVTPYPTGLFTDKNVTIYPNPSKGAFSAGITLDAPGDVRMLIHSSDGKPGGTPIQGSGKANYTFTGSINNSGLFLLEFRTNTGVVTKKLVVIN
ncbi:T9SS type A sorting domain-containing protein [Mucilaginibacter psychrotolerans]|uniref:T9SS type A sorting domain-containing protein n=1 Tax=Mucilaginibacter psychrotolerans TaxID=1524096 RepID=A0A4Y8SIN3_9SPHI|nr:T9SS type A sorting domain-containing protein [Mucilaginibacter psychrotolerans]TFF38510.1 T9SS type A sorting domain-containing protein [Mucilaginibacter psychrotolerans]